MAFLVLVPVKVLINLMTMLRPVVAGQSQLKYWSLSDFEGQLSRSES
jgi:hypothetical protein